jgi:hypothetical protein
MVSCQLEVITESQLDLQLLHKMRSARDVARPPSESGLRQR